MGRVLGSRQKAAGLPDGQIGVCGLRGVVLRSQITDRAVHSVPELKTKAVRIY